MCVHVIVFVCTCAVCAHRFMCVITHSLSISGHCTKVLSKMCVILLLYSKLEDLCVCVYVHSVSFCVCLCECKCEIRTYI